VDDARGFDPRQQATGILAAEERARLIGDLIWRNPAMANPAVCRAKKASSCLGRLWIHRTEGYPVRAVGHFLSSSKRGGEEGGRKPECPLCD
jgi:hypothetical protein